MKNVTTCGLIVAAGRGQRAKSRHADIPKQYQMMPDMPPDMQADMVLTRTLRAFVEHSAIDAVLVVMHPDDSALYEQAIAAINSDKLLAPVAGGDTRQHSVLHGLAALAKIAPKQVLIHDAARPFVQAALIQRCLTGLGSAAGAIPAVAVTDTLKQADNGQIIDTISRDGLWQAQTPQAFHYQAIYAAYQKAQPILDKLTDDAAVAEFSGLALALVAGDAANIKLTHSADFAPPQNMPSQNMLMPRTGSGFDVHGFGAVGSAEHILLGGVKIAYDRALLGHSDADVALHALTDALLGALAMGDIGEHFPPNETANKNRDSAEFLRHAVDLAAQAGAKITHADLTIICETPKITPHKAAMRTRIAQLLGVSQKAISVKATTTEGLGFVGRGEGLAAQAVLTLLMPPDNESAEND